MSTVALVRRFTSLATTLCLCNACLGTETGNPSETRDVSIAMVLKSSNPAIVQNCLGETETESDSAPTALIVQNAWLTTDYLDIHSCLGTDETDTPAFAWNLLHPVARHFKTGISSYCGFDLQTRVADATLGSIPTELSGVSIWMNAVRADKVVVDIRTPVVLSIAKPNSTTPNANSRLVVAFDAAAWLSGINFSALQPGPDGIVHLAPAVNAPVLRVIEQQTSADIVLRTEESDDGVMDD